VAYDLFISYSRNDNKAGQISALIEEITADFLAFSGRPLNAFFDVEEIKGMQDWRHRILHGLRHSRLLLTCLSPTYLDSEYCEWEVNEYLKQELGRAYFGDGIAPLYFVEVPGWNDKDFDRRCAAWVGELRRRQCFDLRPWFYAGRDALRETSVQIQIRELNTQIRERIARGAATEGSLGNVDAHNPHFVGWSAEIRRLREAVVLGRVGLLTAIHGLGGVGKTALAVEYAHAFAHDYGGGRWQVRCEGKDDLGSAIVQLAAPLGIEFTDVEKLDLDAQFSKVLAALRRLAETHEPHRCLLLLDNVDQPKLLQPTETQRLPGDEWLHVIATSRLGEAELFGRHKDRMFLPVDELPESDAVDLLRSYQSGESFKSAAEQQAACEIVRLLGRFTIAVETAAVYLGEFGESISCAAFLERLKTEGLQGLDLASAASGEGIRHGEKRVSATLTPIFERLSAAEKLTLSFASLLPADQIALPWLRSLVAERFAELKYDAEPGYPDPWKNVLRRLLSLRLLRCREVRDSADQITVGRMHRLVQQVWAGQMTEESGKLNDRLIGFATLRAEARFTSMERESGNGRDDLLFGNLYDAAKTPQQEESWETGCLLAFAYKLMLDGDDRNGFALSSNVAAPFIFETLASTLSPVFRSANELAHKSHSRYQRLRKIGTNCGLAAVAALTVGLAGIAHAQAFIIASAPAALAGVVAWMLMRHYQLSWVLNRYKSSLCQRFELIAISDPAVWSGRTQEWRSSMAKELDRISHVSRGDLEVIGRQATAPRAPAIVDHVLPQRLLAYVLNSYKQKRLGGNIRYYWAFASRYANQARWWRVALIALVLILAAVSAGFIGYRLLTAGSYTVAERLGMLCIVAAAAVPVSRNLIGDLRRAVKARELHRIVENTANTLRGLEETLHRTEAQGDLRASYDELLACARLLDADHWQWLRWNLSYD
jgi:hypothetical protein